MTGLILKDFYALRNYLCKQLALMAIIFLGIGLVFKSCSILPIMLMMLMVMTAMSSFNVDESAKWDGYALTLPVTREQIVGAKYLFSVGILLITCVTYTCAVYFGTGATAEEIAVVKCTGNDEADKAEAAFNARVESQISAYENYVPSEVPKLENAIVRRSGVYAVYVTANDEAGAQDIIDQYMN